MIQRDFFLAVYATYKGWKVYKISREIPKLQMFLFKSRTSLTPLSHCSNVTSVSLKFEPHIKAYLSISLDRIVVLAPSIPHLKGLGMRNLQY